MRCFVAALFVNFVFFCCFPVPKSYAQENPNDAFTIYSSIPNDRFVLNIPNTWNTKKESINNGIQYIYWDTQGNAFSIVVKTPNTLISLLKSIEKNEVSKKQLIEIQKEFAVDAPLKRGISLSINVISNRKALTQNYYFKQETLNTVYYIINITHDLLYNNKQYTISYSSGGMTMDKAIQNFEESERRYFTPMLISFFLN